MDTKELFELIDKFDKSGLSVIKYQTDNDSLVLRKEAAAVQAVYAPAEQQAPAAGTTENNRTQAPDNPDTEIITAPIVGTFYRSPSPDSPPFAEEGSSVKAGMTLCIIEAMKVMNALEADYDMEIVHILVEGGSMVEYGAPLLEVKRL